MGHDVRPQPPCSASASFLWALLSINSAINLENCVVSHMPIHLDFESMAYSAVSPENRAVSHMSIRLGSELSTYSAVSLENCVVSHIPVCLCSNVRSSCHLRHGL